MSKYDWVVVDRLMHGVSVPTTEPDITEAIVRMLARGDAPATIAHALNSNVRRVERVAKGKPVALRRSRAACGTPSGRNYHSKNHEPVCDECRAAYNAYSRDLFARKQAGKTATK